ncbi:MAG: hypothetical protein PHC51_08165 [bacterium]|nr:hypothetical protein [bacterium]
METIFLAIFTISVPLLYLLSLRDNKKLWYQRYQLEIMIALQAVFVSQCLIIFLHATPESVFLNLAAAALMIGIACLEPAILVLLICMVVAYVHVNQVAVIYAAILASSTLLLLILKVLRPYQGMQSYGKVLLLMATWPFLDYLPGMLFLHLATATWLAARAIQAIRVAECLEQNLGNTFDLLEFPAPREQAALAFRTLSSLSDESRKALDRLLERYADHALEISVKIDKLLGRADELSMIIADFEPGETQPEPSHFVIESESLKLADDIRLMETSTEVSERMREELIQCRKMLLNQLAGYLKYLQPLRTTWARQLLKDFNPYSVDSSSSLIAELEIAEKVLFATKKVLISVGNNTRFVLELEHLLGRIHSAIEGVYIGKQEH